jgi:hypothetical protein
VILEVTGPAFVDFGLPNTADAAGKRSIQPVATASVCAAIVNGTITGPTTPLRASARLTSVEH